MIAARLCSSYRPCALCGSAIRLAIEFEQRAAGVFWGSARICGPLRVIGRAPYEPTRGDSAPPVAGLVLEFAPESRTGPGRAARCVIPQRWLLGDGGEALRALADAGLALAADPVADVLVIRYLRLAAADLRRGGRDGR